MATTWLNDLLGYRSIRANALAAVTRRGGLRVVGGDGVVVALADDPALGESVLTLSSSEVSGGVEIVPVTGATLNLSAAAHRFKCLLCTNAAGCVISVPTNEFAANDWVMIIGADPDPVSFTGAAVITPPASKLAQTAEAGATIALLFTAAGAARAMGELADA